MVIYNQLHKRKKIVGLIIESIVCLSLRTLVKATVDGVSTVIVSLGSTDSSFATLNFIQLHQENIAYYS